MKFIKVHPTGNNPLRPSYLAIAKIGAISERSSGCLVSPTVMVTEGFLVVESAEQVLQLIQNA